MPNTVMAKMAVQIAANTAEFNKALAATNKGISGFTSNITKVAGVLGAAFGVQQVASFALEISKLAGEAVGVEAAFGRLRNSTKLLNDLKEATGNTVSELELMKRAVQASNFDISLEALPRLLEFATLRAQQTGQSVDYLVDSIVTGIGRKSKLILDNLGISAEQLKQEFNGASLEAQSVGEVAEAVGRIAEKNLKNMAGFSQNAATSMQQLGAAWEDLRVSIGKLVNSSGISTLISNMASMARFFAGDFTLTKEQLDKTIVALNELRNKAIELGNQKDVQKYTKGIAELTSQYGLLKDKAIEFNQENEKQVQTYDDLIDAKQELNKQFQESDRNDIKELNNIGQKIIAIDAQIKKIDELRKAKEAKPTKVNLILEENQGSFGGEGDIRNQQQAKAAEDFSKELTAIGTSAEFAGGALVQLSEDGGNAFKELAEKAIDMSSLIVGGIVDIASAFGEAAITGALDFGRVFLRSLGRFAQQFGALLIATGLGEKALKFGGPGAKIAAGIALVAIGGAISALMSNKPSLSGSGSGEGGSAFYRPSVLNTGYGDITVTGRLVGEGSSLIAVIDNANSANGRRKA